MNCLGRLKCYSTLSTKQFILNQNISENKN